MPGDQVLAKAREIADGLARSAPLSLRAIKEVVGGTEDMSIRDAFGAIHAGRFQIYERMLASEDHEEGPAGLRGEAGAGLQGSVGGFTVTPTRYGLGSVRGPARTAEGPQANTPPSSEI